MRVAFVLRFTEALPGYQICSFLLGIAAFPGSYFDVYCRLVWLFCSWFFFFLLAFIPPRLPMPPCVVRPVGPPARAGEHSKPSCLQARAVRARRTDVLGVGGAPSPERPKSCLRARALPSYSYRGGCHPPALSSCSLVAPVGPAAGCRGPPTIHPSIHPSIQVCLSFARARHPPFHANRSSIHARRPVALGMHPSLPCTPTCRARFAGALLVIPDLPHPINRARCDAANGVPCPTQVAGVGHARGAAAQWWWAHGGPAGVIGGKNCTNGK